MNKLYLIITGAFNNRELASIIWVVVLLILVSIKSQEFWYRVRNLLVTIFKLWKIFVLTIGYILINLFIFNKIGIWNLGLVKITTFWFFGWAIIVLFNSHKIHSKKDYLKEVIVEIFGLTVIISFISNFYSFPLLIELLFIPFAVIFYSISTLLLYNSDHKLLRKLSNGILVVLGLFIFCISFYKTIINFNEFMTQDTLLEFIMPAILSAVFVPFVLVVSIYGRWEQRKVFKKIYAQNKIKR